MPPMRSKTTSGLSGLQFQRCELILPSSAPCDKNDKVFKSSCHANNMLQNLNLFRQDSKFCDVEIVAGNAVIKVSYFYFVGYFVLHYGWKIYLILIHL